MRAVWTYDEIVLACELARQNGWQQQREGDASVVELSALLRRANIHPADGRDDSFRSIGSVSRKIADIVTRHPDYEGKPTQGNRLDRKVLEEFLREPERMKKTALAIWQAIEGDGKFTTDLDEIEHSAQEGKVLWVQHARRERNPKLRQQKIAQALESGIGLSCEVCGFNFEEKYGERGSGYIEVHHVRPLHDSGPVATRLRDLALVCSNCHRMLHRTSAWLTPEALRDLITDVGAVPD